MDMDMDMDMDVDMDMDASSIRIRPDDGPVGSWRYCLGKYCRQSTSTAQSHLGNEVQFALKWTTKNICPGNTKRPTGGGNPATPANSKEKTSKNWKREEKERIQQENRLEIEKRISNRNRWEWNWIAEIVKIEQIQAKSANESTNIIKIAEGAGDGGRKTGGEVFAIATTGGKTNRELKNNMMTLKNKQTEI